LVRACLAGDRAAETQLFRTHVQQVHRLVRRVVGVDANVDDLVQDAFIRVYRSLQKFRGEARLATWIGRIALRVAFEHLATTRRLRPIEAVPEPAAPDGPLDDRLAAREALRRLDRLLDRLDPKHRIAFTLHVLDGLPQEEVAALMGASLVATKARVWRARRELDKRARRDVVLAPLLLSAQQTAP
jgi:RNA polymerase sigma-70 factor (ECF subfamily)